MKPSTVATSGSGSRDEVRRRFLAACVADGNGRHPADVDSFVVNFDEPERSQVRSELLALAESWRRGDSLSGAGAAPNATADYVRPPTDELGGLVNVLTHGAGTLGYAPKAAAAPEVTIDSRPSSDTIDDAVEKPNKTVAGYEILGVLGRGAMGVVYKARQRGLKRIVALKMILSGGHASEHELARFRSEAQAVAELQHAGIVQLYEVGEDEGRPFFSLEFVDGTPLDKKIRAAPLPSRETARVMQQMAEAMAYAHGKGIIHRDLKPANVLLTKDGTPKISDFGLAKSVAEDSGQTRAGTVLGTPSYMSPEQAEGRSKDVGPLADVYSLGAVLYDLLAGRAPFRGTTVMETLAQVCTKEPVPPRQLQPDVPLDLETICLKCLQKDPARRYANSQALADDLGRYLRGEPIVARPVGRVERAWKLCKRHPGKAAAIIGALALILGWAASVTVLNRDLTIQTNEALKQTGIAKDNADKAKENADRADKEADIARQHEQAAKDTADGTIQEMVQLGKLVQTRLQNRKLSIGAAPEVKKLRDDLLATLRQSLSIVGSRVDAAGATPFVRVGLAQNLGDLLDKLGQGQEALRLYQQGYDLAKKLAEAQPDSDVARANLGVMAVRLGHIALKTNHDPKTAVGYYQQARDLHADVIANPRDHYYKGDKEFALRANLSHDNLHLGEAYLAWGDAASARQALLDSLAYREAWLERSPKSPEARGYVWEAQMQLGVAAACLNDEKAMLDHFRKALAIGESIQLPDAVAQKNPLTDFEFRTDLAKTQLLFGNALFMFGKLAEAESQCQAALANLEKAAKRNPDDVAAQTILAEASEQLAAVCRCLGKSADAQKHAQDALLLRQELLQIETNSIGRQADYLVALARTGKADAAAGLAAKLRSKATASPPLLLKFARCLALAARGEQPQAAANRKLALDCLRAATAAGYRCRIVLEADSDFENLCAEPEFRKIMDAIH